MERKHTDFPVKEKVPGGATSKKSPTDSLLEYERIYHDASINSVSNGEIL